MSLFSGYIKHRIKKNFGALKITERFYYFLYLINSKDYFRRYPHNDVHYLQAFQYNNFDSIKVADLYIDFRFDIPEPYSSRLRDYNFFTNHSEGNCNQNDTILNKLILFIQSNYPFLTNSPLSIISQHINLTADNFLRELDNGKSKSNNTILGIESIKMLKHRATEIGLFTTDYFTYNCIVSLYKYLYKINSAPFIISSTNDIEKITPFLCCCGIGGFVNLYYKGSLIGNSIVNKNPFESLKGTLVSKRSNSAACPNHWHASFDETFDIRDKENLLQGEKPSLKACLSRGLNEELGIHYNPQKHQIDNIVLFYICSNERLETEFFISIDIEIKSEEELRLFIDKYQCASDAENENSHLIMVPSKEVYNFFLSKKEIGESVTPEALELSHFYYTLENNRLLRIFKYLKNL